jgi:Peptidase family S58
MGPVRTGVTAILPRGRASSDQVFAGWFSLNGNGEMTGTSWIEEAGFLEGPVFITNTHSVGTVRDASKANHGARRLLRIAGVPVDQALPQAPPPRPADLPAGRDALVETGSIIIVVATEAPLLPHQLKPRVGSSGDDDWRGQPSAGSDRSRGVAAGPANIQSPGRIERRFEPEVGSVRAGREQGRNQILVRKGRQAIGMTLLTLLEPIGFHVEVECLSLAFNSSHSSWHQVLTPAEPVT